MKMQNITVIQIYIRVNFRNCTVSGFMCHLSVIKDNLYAKTTKLTKEEPRRNQSCYIYKGFESEPNSDVSSHPL